MGGPVAVVTGEFSPARQVVVSQTLMVLSDAVLASSFPSGLKATTVALLPGECPRIASCSLPVPASQTATVPCSSAAASRCPSGLNAIL